MIKKKQQNNGQQNQKQKLGYFLEQGFNSQEQVFNQNQLLEFNPQNYSRLAKNYCKNSLNLNNNSTSFNFNNVSKQNITGSPRLLTASTTHRSFATNSNLLHSISTTQPAKSNNNLLNSYRLSPQLNTQQKQSFHDYSNPLSTTSSKKNGDNIFLNDNFQLSSSSRDVQKSQIKQNTLLYSPQSESIKKKLQKNSSTHQLNQNNSSLQQNYTDSMSNDHIIETPTSYHSHYNSATALITSQNQKSPELNPSHSPNKYNKTSISLYQNPTLKLKPSSSSKALVQQGSPPILKNLQNKMIKNRSEVNAPIPTLPMTSRLQEFIDNKVKEKFFKNLMVPSQQQDKSENNSNQQLISSKEVSNKYHLKEEYPLCSIMNIVTPFESIRKITNSLTQNQYILLKEKESIIEHVNNQFYFFLNEYKRVSNMYKLSTTYRQGISNLHSSHSQCTNKLLAHIGEWQECKKNKNSTSENHNFANIVEMTADNLAVDVFISKNPMQIMSVSLSCAKIYISLKKPIKAIPILKQCKRLSDLYRNQKYKMKCYKALSEAFMMIRKDQIAEKFIKKYLQLSWCIKSEKNELQAYDMLGLMSYYNGDVEGAKFYHHRMANNILEDETSQLKKISLLNQMTKQKRRDEKMKEENPPISRKVEGDDNIFLDSSEEETEEILLVPEPNQQKQNEWKAKVNLRSNRNQTDNSLQLEGNADEYSYLTEDETKEGSVSPHIYLSYKQGYQLRKQTINDTHDQYLQKRIITEANTRIRQTKKVYKLMGPDKISIPVNPQKLDFGPLKKPIFISHLSRNRALQNFQKFELQNKIDLSGEGDINYWEPYDLKKAESRLWKQLKIQSYFKYILQDFSNDMNANIMLTDDRNKYFSEKAFSVRFYLSTLSNKYQMASFKQIKSYRK